MTETKISIYRFWAKTTHDADLLPNAYHPLICHLIDVACVAKIMWRDVLPEVTKCRLAKPFGREDDLEKAGGIIAFLTGLHDLGKCSPPFALRGKNRPDSDQTKRLCALYAETDCYCDTVDAHRVPHGYVTALTLPDILVAKYGLAFQFAKSLSEIIGGHHGIFATGSDMQAIRPLKERALGDEAWRSSRVELTDALADLLDVSIDGVRCSPQKLDNATAMILAGFVSVADWIGSNTEYFECEVGDSTVTSDLSLDQYLEKSRACADRALTDLGWKKWPRSSQTKEFETLFPKIEIKRDLQAKAVEIAKQIKGPGIFIVEALMGEGKTETAMYLADYLNASGGTRGIYFALPSQATSNQMFGRVAGFLRHRFNGDDDFINLMLQHGHASLSDEFVAGICEFRAIKNTYADGDGSFTKLSNVAAAEWFTRKKCGLLAPFGVGTIDQILLAALQTKHVFVRLFGLAHRTIIIDEVHAYDAYMSTLLERLLEWLAALGSPVIILSATLPKARRNALIKAYLSGLGQEFAEREQPTTTGDADEYPRISFAHTDTAAKTFQVTSLKTSPENIRTLNLELKDEDDFISDLKEKLLGGGCAAIICNTVDRAQTLYKHLKADLFFAGLADDGLPRLGLLHSRYRFIDRQEREKHALLRFGKAGSTVLLTENGRKAKHTVKRPDMAVLISTQIIEQSLDLDFDLMITDLAPADLLLQRLGRLQRHDRQSERIDEKDKRPSEFLDPSTGAAKPSLWILRPPLDETGELKIIENGKYAGELDFGVTGLIYDKHILLRSWLALKDRATINVPVEVEELVETVYGDAKCPKDVDLEMWRRTACLLEHKLKAKEFKAKAVRIAETSEDDFFESFKFHLDEEDPTKHSMLRAQTRDDERRSVSVVILTENEALEIASEPALTPETEEFLTHREVKLNRPGVTQELIGEPKFAVESWRQSSLLRHHRRLILEDSNPTMVGTTLIRLDDDLGIVFG